MRLLGLEWDAEDAGESGRYPTVFIQFSSGLEYGVAVHDVEKIRARW